MKKFLLITFFFSSYSFSQCFVKISSGEQHTVAIADDGTLWGWGSNTSGECGVLPNQNLLSPTQIGTTSDWIDIDCGPYHSIALRSNGDVYTMGFNNVGQCGTGNTATVTSPNLVATNVINVAAGKGNTSYLIKSDSTLWATGLNNGKYGNNTTANSLSFIQVNNGYKWVEIAGGNTHTIGLDHLGNVLTSGSNLTGQLGYDSFGMNNVLIFINALPPGINIVDVDAGIQFSMALADNGIVYTFGRNDYGQLGDGTINSTYNWQIPTDILNHTIDKIKAGYSGAMATSTSSVLTWGRNMGYNLTSPVAGDNLIPYEWSFANAPTDASMGVFNTAIIIDNEGVYNWGQNDRGNCGNGTLNNSSSPELNDAACGASCDITSVVIDNVSACDPATNSYTVTFTTIYENAAPADSMVVGGFGMPTVRFLVTGSPQTETLTVDFDEINGSFSLSVSLETYNTLYSNFSCVNPGIANPWTAPVPCSTTSSIDELSETIRVYPNPAGNKLNISLSQPSSIVVSNLNGKQLLTTESNMTHKLNVSDLDSGIYFIQTENGSTQKFIKN